MNDNHCGICEHFRYEYTFDDIRHGECHPPYADGAPFDYHIMMQETDGTKCEAFVRGDPTCSGCGCDMKGVWPRAADVREVDGKWLTYLYCPSCAVDVCKAASEAQS